MAEKKHPQESSYMAKVDELKGKLRKMRFDNKLGQLDDTSKIKKLKKEIAALFTRERDKTISNQKKA